MNKQIQKYAQLRSADVDAGLIGEKTARNNIEGFKEAVEGGNFEAFKRHLNKLVNYGEAFMSKEEANAQLKGFLDYVLDYGGN